MAFDANKCLKVKALEDNTVFTLLPYNGTKGSKEYYFSKTGADGDWQADTITLNAGETAYVKGTEYPGTSDQMSRYCLKAKVDGSFANFEIISGNVMSLVDDGAGALTEITQAYAFASLFDATDQYEKGLTKIPSGLLPATVLSERCYQSMFYSTSLMTLPKGLLPAKTLAPYCYAAMFQSCRHLAEVPSGVIINATGASQSYSSMFKACGVLRSISVGFTTWPDGMTNWVSGVSSNGIFYCPEALEEKHGASKIPNNWRVVWNYPNKTCVFQVGLFGSAGIGGL